MTITNRATNQQPVTLQVPVEATRQDPAPVLPLLLPLVLPLFWVLRRVTVSDDWTTQFGRKLLLWNVLNGVSLWSTHSSIG